MASPIQLNPSPPTARQRHGTPDMLMPTTLHRAHARLAAAEAITNRASRVQRNRLSGARRGLFRVLWLGEHWNA